MSKLYAGFTLVELLITVAIIGALSSISIHFYKGYMSKTYFEAANHQVNILATEAVLNLALTGSCSGDSVHKRDLTANGVGFWRKAPVRGIKKFRVRNQGLSGCRIGAELNGAESTASFENKWIVLETWKTVKNNNIACFSSISPTLSGLDYGSLNCVYDPDAYSRVQ